MKASHRVVEARILDPFFIAVVLQTAHAAAEAAAAKGKKSPWEKVSFFSHAQWTFCYFFSWDFFYALCCQWLFQHVLALEAPFEAAAANLWGENMRLIIWIYGYLPRLRSSLDTTAVVVGVSGLLLRSWLCSLWFFCFSLLLCVICITNGNIMRQTGEKATIAALRRFWNAQNQAEFGTSQVDSSKIMVPWESSNLFESLLA